MEEAYIQPELKKKTLTKLKRWMKLITSLKKMVLKAIWMMQNTKFSHH